MMRALFFSLTLLLASTMTYAKTNSLSALSFNLHCFENQWEKRLEILAKEIAQLSPSVLAFQEVCTSENASMIDALKDKLLASGYPLQETSSIFTHRAWDKYDEHIVIMSKEKAEAIESGLLPPSPLQRAYVSIKVQNIFFVNTHLEHLDPKYRKEEINFLIKNFAARPHIIMGDLNSNPKNQEQRAFFDSGYTPFFTGPTYPSTKPTMTFDGFWVSQEVSKQPVANTARVFEQSYDGLFLSDHTGVLFKLVR